MSESEKDFTANSYLEYIQEKKLMGSQCKKCSEMFVPPRKICTKCNSLDMEWIEMGGKGKLAAYSCIGVGTKAMVDKGYSMKKPYCFSIMKLDEGPMVSGQLVGVDETKPDTIKIDSPLRIKFLETNLEGGESRIDLGFEPV